MKRKLLTLLLTLSALLALAPPVSADLIWEPDDAFYNKHRDECTYVNRRYQLAGYDGTVTVLTAPGGMSKTTLDNGLKATVQFIWEDRETAWGYLLWIEDHDVEGWAPMDDLSLVYDSQQFMEDHAGEITEGDPAEVDFHEAVLYRYPNGDAGDATLKEDPQYLPFSETFTTLYTDENGLRWGYIGYYMGRRNYWVCLDDPMNENLNSGIEPVQPSPAQLRGSATVPAAPPVLLLATIPVALVVLATAVLILRLKRRGR